MMIKHLPIYTMHSYIYLWSHPLYKGCGNSGVLKLGHTSNLYGRRISFNTSLPGTGLFELVFRLQLGINGEKAESHLRSGLVDYLFTPEHGIPGGDEFYGFWFGENYSWDEVAGGSEFYNRDGNALGLPKIEDKLTELIDQSEFSYTLLTPEEVRYIVINELQGARQSVWAFALCEVKRDDSNSVKLGLFHFRQNPQFGHLIPDGELEGLDFGKLYPRYLQFCHRNKLPLISSSHFKPTLSALFDRVGLPNVWGRAEKGIGTHCFFNITLTHKPFWQESYIIENVERLVKSRAVKTQ